MNKRLAMIGDGGHARSCSDIINSFNTYSISRGANAFVSKTISDSRTVDDSEWRRLSKLYDFVLGVGQIHSAKTRIDIVGKVVKNGGRFATLISPDSRVSKWCRVGEGTVVMPGACINAGASVGKYCIINTGAIIEHDARVLSFCHISTGAVVNGDCGVGRRSFVGSNAVLLNQIQVCPDTTIGAGSVVTSRITEPGGIYVGNPATLLRRKN